MVKISITNLQRKVPIPVSKITSAAAKAAQRLKLKSELSIVFVGPQRMRSLNRKYLGHDYVTDVITFEHGEVVICPSVAQRNARRYSNSTIKELVLYAVHGLLHLAGFDDRSEEDRLRMRKEEEKFLAIL